MNPLMIWLILACLILNLITLILVIVLLNQNKKITMHAAGSGVGDGAGIGNAVGVGVNQMDPPTAQGIVFCRNCGSQYDSTLNVCPNCKTPR